MIVLSCSHFLIRSRVINLADGARVWCRHSIRTRHSGSTGDAGNFAPSLKGTITGGAIVGSGQEVATELEEVVDLAVAGKEPLGVPCRLEALHLP